MNTPELLPKLKPNWAPECSWLDPESPAHGLGVDVQRAVTQLAKVFTPSFCRRAIQKGELRLIVPLLMPHAWILWHAAPLLFLGDDLAECEGWEAHKSLAKGLRRLDAHWQARFEVALWAGMRRQGIEVDRVAEGQGKSADFVLEDAGLKIALEAKVLSSSDYSKNLATLERAIGSWLWPGSGISLGPPLPDPDPHSLCFVPSSRMLVLLHSTKPEDFDDVFGNLLRRVFQEWYAENGTCLEFGMRVQLPSDLGHFDIEDSEDLSYRVHAEETGPYGDFERVLARVRDAGAQLAQHEVDVRVAVVWTPRFTAPISEAIPVLEHLISVNPNEYEHLDWIVVLNVGWDNDGKFTPKTVAHRVRANAPDITSTRWYEGIRDWRLLR
jgi:hypothetical protein